MEWLLEHNESCSIVVPYTRARQPKWLQPWLEQMERVVELQLPTQETPPLTGIVIWWIFAGS